MWLTPPIIPITPITPIIPITPITPIIPIIPITPIIARVALTSTYSNLTATLEQPYSHQFVNLLIRNFAVMSFSLYLCIFNYHKYLYERKKYII